MIERQPLFQQLPIKDKKAEQENHMLLINGREMDFFAIKGKEWEVLVNLASASKKNPISSSGLAKAIYGDKIPLSDAKNRANTNLSKLSKELKGHDVIIVRIKMRKADGKRESFYHLASGEDLIEENNLKRIIKESAIFLERRTTIVVLINGKEIVFKGTKKEIDVLRILEKASKENPISSSRLAIAVCGDKIPLSDAKNRTITVLSKLRGELKACGAVVMSEIIRRKEAKIDIRREENSYYLALANEKDFIKKNNLWEIIKATRKEIRILKILERVSSGSVISDSTLIEALYGDKIPLLNAKMRLGHVLKHLRRKLKEYNMVIACIKIRKKRESLSMKKAENFYCLISADKADSVVGRLRKKLQRAKKSLEERDGITIEPDLRGCMERIPNWSKWEYSGNYCKNGSLRLKIFVQKSA
jgi:RNA binding exosome subunit